MEFCKSLVERTRRRWHRKSGYGEVLQLAVPLILSTGSISIQHFIDRMFLTWYSPDAIAAAVPAGLLSFTLMCLSIGTAAYVTTFVAQYYGARQYDKVTPVVWQGIYFALGSGVLFLVFMPLSVPIFNLADHAAAVKNLEIRYFKILCLGATPVFIKAAVSGFFTGRGRTWIIMWINLLATGINIILDYLLIFGSLGFPELGIGGAAIATITAGYVSAAVMVFLMFTSGFRKKFTLPGSYRFKPRLFKRLMRFGLPNGAQFMLDLLGFTLFILLVGRFGTPALAATNIAFNINSLAFLPMIGLGMAVEIIVAQRLGENRPRLARYGTYSALHITLFYMGVMALTYVLLPQLYLFPFAAQADMQTFGRVQEITVVLLRFVAFYSLFDTMNIVFANALKGAGDTRFVMVACVILSWGVMIIPTYLASVVFDWGLYTSWIFVTAYIVVLGLVFLARFLGGKWESMRVIEETPPIIPHDLPENPIG